MAAHGVLWEYGEGGREGGCEAPVSERQAALLGMGTLILRHTDGHARKSKKLPVQRGLKRRGVTAVVCAACQLGTSAKRLGMLQAKIFCKLAPAGSSKGQLLLILRVISYMA